MKELLRKIQEAISNKPKVPKCFSDESFMYCYCRKCEAKSYELPEDFKRILAIKVAEDYKKNRGINLN